MAEAELTWSGEEETQDVNSPSVLLGHPFLNTSHKYDYETRLYYTLARYYKGNRLCLSI
jgi:hypothetical protein